METTVKKRCPWAERNRLYVAYHDCEWGVPVHDDRLLFEMLSLGGAQAGLNWLTVLKRRENYRRAFDRFDVEKIAAYTDRDVNRLLADAGIIRNHLKINSVIHNARSVLQLQEKDTTLDSFLWRYVDGRPMHNSWASVNEIPATSDVSDAMSKDLKKAGFSFVGSTICYAFMQAIGMVNDHMPGCFRYGELRRHHASA